MRSEVVENERDTVLRHLAYDHLTGVFVWIAVPRKAQRVKVGDIAGTVTAAGYVAIKLFGKPRLAHRLAWLIQHGDWPSQCIDHINGIRHDNRLANLRDVSQLANTQNRRAACKGSATGLLGVAACKDKFRASINVVGVRTDLGVFSAPEAAHDAYLNAKRLFHVGSTL